MEDKKQETKRILVYPIHGEIVPQRLWYALTDDNSPAKDLFEVSGFAGRHPLEGEDNIIERLDLEIEKRREEGFDEVVRSLEEFKDKIKSGEVDYYHLDDENCTVPDEAYENCDCVFIGTNNLTHVDYVEDAINHGKDFICEKPYAVKLRDLRKACKLEERIRDKKLVGKITSHFAHKPAFLEFSDNLSDLVEKYGGIERFEGHYEEFDIPDNKRVRATLDPDKSGGGIYLDTGCHFYSMLFQIGADLESVVDGTDSFEWDSYDDYPTDTFARVRHINVNGGNFSNAEVEITVSKFADKYRHNPENENEEPRSEEYKELILTFEEEYRAHVMFPDGKIEIRKDTNGFEEVIETIHAKPKHVRNEYSNILVDFHDRLTNGHGPYTLTDNGIKACSAIIETYFDFKTNGSRIELYEQP